MAAVSSQAEYLDDEGNRWLVRTVLHEGGHDLLVTPPGLKPRLLKPRPPKTCDTSRPSVDADEPLPLENL